MLEWSLTDDLCRTIAVFDQRPPGSNITLPIFQPKRASLTVSIEDDQVHKVAPLRTNLYAEYYGIPVFHGPVLDPVFHGAEGTIEIPAVDGSEWLARWPFPNQLDSAGTYAGIALAALAARAVTTNPIFGIRRERILAGAISYFGSYSHVWDAGSNAWQVLTDLSQLLDGIEFDLQPLAPDVLYPNGSGIPVAAYAQLNIAQRIGQDLQDYLKFEYGGGEDNCANMSFSPLGSSVKNNITVTGAADENGVQPFGASWKQTSIDLNDSWGSYESSDLQSSAACVARARLIASGYGDSPNSFSITPAMEGQMNKETERPYGVPPQFLRDYGIGDTIQAIGTFGSKQYTGIGRVTQGVLTEDDSHGNCKVTLSIIPRVVADGVA